MNETEFGVWLANLRALGVAQKQRLVAALTDADPATAAAHEFEPGPTALSIF